jgi:WD40 repeat protein
MQNNFLLIWNWSNNSILFTLPSYCGVFTPMKFLKNGTLLAAPASNVSMGVWNVSTGQILFNLTVGSNTLAVEELANGHLAISNNKKQIQTWSLSLGVLVSQLNKNASQVALKQTPINSYLASGSQDGLIYLRNINSLVLVATLKGHTSSVTSLDVTPSSGLLLSTGNDQFVRVWNLTTFACLSALDSTFGLFTISQMRVLSNSQVVIGGLVNYVRIIGINAQGNLSLETTQTLGYGSSGLLDFRLTSQNVLVVANANGAVSFLNLNTSTFTQSLTPLSGGQPRFMDIIG